MTAPTGLRGSDGLPIALGQQVGQAGGEGAVYAVLDRAPASVAKIFKQPPAHGGAKLRAMIAAPPRGAPLDGEQPALTWPRELVLDAGGQVVGYLMARLDDSAVEFTEMSDPRFRADVRTATNRPFDWHDLHIVAANLAGVVAACHAASYVVGDLNPKNVRVHPTGQVTLIDTDSFQVTIGATVHHCGVFRVEFLAPELFGKEIHTHTRAVTSDLHSLAVLLYKVLQDGAHPFMGIDSEAEEPPGPVDFVKRRVYPLDQGRPHPHVGPNPRALPLGRLHPALIDLFQRTFGPGLTAPHQRATAAQWAKALTFAQQDLRGCRGGHLYAATPGRICLHRTNAGYCGATADHATSGPVAFVRIDALTGDWTPEAKPVGGIRIEIVTDAGGPLPIGTEVVLSGATVVVERKLTKPTQQVTVERTELPVGRYRLDISHAPGLRPAEIVVDVERGQLSKQKIRLLPEHTRPEMAWPEIVVTLDPRLPTPSVPLSWLVTSKSSHGTNEEGQALEFVSGSRIVPMQKLWNRGHYLVRVTYGRSTTTADLTIRNGDHGPIEMKIHLGLRNGAVNMRVFDVTAIDFPAGTALKIYRTSGKVKQLIQEERALVFVPKVIYRFEIPASDYGDYLMAAEWNGATLLSKAAKIDSGSAMRLTLRMDLRVVNKERRIFQVIASDAPAGTALKILLVSNGVRALIKEERVALSLPEIVLRFDIPASIVGEFVVLAERHGKTISSKTVLVTLQSVREIKVDLGRFSFNPTITAPIPVPSSSTQPLAAPQLVAKPKPALTPPQSIETSVAAKTGTTPVASAPTIAEPNRSQISKAATELPAADSWPPVVQLGLPRVDHNRVEIVLSNPSEKPLIPVKVTVHKIDPGTDIPYATADCPTYDRSVGRVQSRILLPATLEGGRYRVDVSHQDLTWSSSFDVDSVQPSAQSVEIILANAVPDGAGTLVSAVVGLWEKQIRRRLESVLANLKD